ncbi:MAG: TolC family protein [Proteobacteria bacterium]|nr:TolC family protein [Pseudomonadota bacterium]
MSGKAIFLLLVVSSMMATPLRVAAETLDQLRVLDLETAQRIALADNPTLAAAAERVEAARQRIDQARALYWPSIDASTSAAASRLSENDAASQSLLLSGVDVDRDNETYQLSLAASWLLFDGFSRKFSNLIADYGQQESEQARRDGMRLLLQSVAESYYGAQLALSNKAIAEADFKFNAQQLAEARIRMELGAGALSEVLNFQVQMNNARSDILIAERDYELAFSGLAVLLGRKSGQMPEGLALAKVEMVEEEQFYELSPEQLLQTALSHRPDLLGQEVNLQQAESTVGVNQAALYPKVSLNGSVDGNRADDVDFEGADFGSALSLNLSCNLFRGGGDQARIAEARASKREVARLLEQQRNKVSSEVRQAITRLEQARQQLLLQRASEQLVEQTRDLVQEGYRAGQESLSRLNEVQRDLVRTQSRLALALVALYTNRQGLTTATGESLIPYLKGDQTAANTPQEPAESSGQATY